MTDDKMGACQGCGQRVQIDDPPDHHVEADHHGEYQCGPVIPDYQCGYEHCPGGHPTDAGVCKAMFTGEAHD